MNYSFSEPARSMSLFVLAGLCEIGGGWLIWQWLRDSKPGWWGLIGGVVLMLYGVVSHVSACPLWAGVCRLRWVLIVLSLLWGWWLDGNVPDRFDVFGAAIALAGVCFMMYWPR